MLNAEDNTDWKLDGEISVQMKILARIQNTLRVECPNISIIFKVLIYIAMSSSYTNGKDLMKQLIERISRTTHS